VPKDEPSGLRKLSAQSDLDVGAKPPAKLPRQRDREQAPASTASNHI